MGHKGPPAVFLAITSGLNYALNLGLLYGTKVSIIAPNKCKLGRMTHQSKANTSK
jgi:hypothetical protein